MRRTYYRRRLMKLRAVFASLVVAAVAPSDVAAKGVAALVVVGSDERSIKIEPERPVLSVMLYHPASVYDVKPAPAPPRGDYLKIYPLGPGGFPAIPGRFYPTTRALCFSWNQAVVPASCGRLGRPRRLLAASRRLAAFHGRPTVLATLRPGSTENLVAALRGGFVARRKVRLAVLGGAGRDRAAAGHFSVELGSKEDRDVREPQPDQEDHDGAEAPVGLVVGAELRDVEGKQR